jgi:hypothetical protein
MICYGLQPEAVCSINDHFKEISELPNHEKFILRRVGLLFLRYINLGVAQLNREPATREEGSQQ